MKSALALVLAAIVAGCAYWWMHAGRSAAPRPVPAASSAPNAPANPAGALDPGVADARPSSPERSAPKRVAAAAGTPPAASVPEGIIDPNHELLAATNQPEPRDSDGEKRPDPSTPPPADFARDEELAQKYAGGRPEDLREIVRALQALLDDDYARLKSGQAAALSETQQAHIQHEIQWLKAHGGS